MNHNSENEGIMERVRANLSRRGQGEALRTTPFGATPYDGSRREGPGSADQATALDFSAYDFSSLNHEVEGALAGHQMVGQMNPRPPGAYNRGVQFLKRAMLRLLTFYTRPLHSFQSSTIRALQNTSLALKTHDEELLELKRNLAQQSKVLGKAKQQDWDIVRTVQAASQRAAVLIADQRKLEKQLADLKAALLGTSEESQAPQASLASITERLDLGLRGVQEGVVELANSVDQRYNNLLSRIEAHETRLDALPEGIASMATELGQIQTQLEGVQRQLQDAATRVRLQGRDLRRYVNEALAGKTDSNAAGTGPVAPAVPAMFASGIPAEGSFDYFRFEELYRGDEALIAQRQKEYLEYFRGRDNVVDLGCGRGEFLELLRDNGIHAKGVELGSDQYLLCREKHLDVVQQDLFEFLEGLKDGSLGGIFSAQVIEHLTASDQLRLVSLAYRKTSSGSPVIIETINAQSVFAVMRNFFLDPTHVRPVHPETLKVAMESAKFRDVELRFSSLYTEKRIPPLELAGNGVQLAEFNRAMSALNDLVYGYLDYAAIGWH